MKLVVTTPTALVLEVSGVRALRAEDATGSFGIQPGHESFLTALEVSVLSWRGTGDREHYVAVQGGILSVRSDGSVEVATRDAVAADDLDALEASTLELFRQRERRESAEKTRAQRLHAGAVRRICQYLRRAPAGRLGAEDAGA